MLTLEEIDRLDLGGHPYPDSTPQEREALARSEAAVRGLIRENRVRDAIFVAHRGADGRFVLPPDVRRELGRRGVML